LSNNQTAQNRYRTIIEWLPNDWIRLGMITND